MIYYNLNIKIRLKVNIIIRIYFRRCIKIRILVVEDEPNLLSVIEKKLKGENYSVDTCDNGNDVDAYIKLTEYDIILLDIMLPGISGLEILEKLRSSGDKTPVILLTAKDTISDRVRGLDLGADDYLVKPFSFDELLARIRALSRRNHENPSNEFKIADLTLNIQTHTVTRGSTIINLSSKEFAILECLIKNKGIVLSRARIEEHVWNYDFEGGSNVIDVYIRYLRRKIDKDFEPKLIHTIRGSGYVLRDET